MKNTKSMKFDKEYWDNLDREIPGWQSETEARFLIENIKGNSYLEIGVAYGKSLRVVKHHFPEMELVAGLDLIDHGVHKKVKGVEILYIDSVKFSEYASAKSPKYWFARHTISTLFIDGDHTYKGCLSDFVYWFNKVKPGGKIIFHDYGRPTKEHEGVTRAVDAIKPLLKDFKKTNFIACGTKD